MQCSAWRDLSLLEESSGTWMFTLVRIGGSSVGPVAPRTQRTFYSLAWPAMDVEIPPSSRRVAAPATKHHKAGLVNYSRRNRLHLHPPPPSSFSEYDEGGRGKKKPAHWTYVAILSSYEATRRNGLSICRYVAILYARTFVDWLTNFWRIALSLEGTNNNVWFMGVT